MSFSAQLRTLESREQLAEKITNACKSNDSTLFVALLMEMAESLSLPQGELLNRAELGTLLCEGFAPEEKGFLDKVAMNPTNVVLLRYNVQRAKEPTSRLPIGDCWD